MPPKKKGKGKKKGVPPLDDFDTTEMTREQLAALAYRLQEEMKREREERSFFQTERDKLRAFWEVTRKQLDECRAELRNKDRQREDDDVGRIGELKDNEQKVKYLTMEYQKSLDDMKLEYMESLKKSQEEFDTQTLLLRKDKMDALQRLREQSEAHRETERNMKLEYSSEMTETRNEHTNEVADLSGYFERHVAQVRSALELKQRVELIESEERQKTQIDTLLKNHAKALSELKNYYNEITLNNLSLVASLKAECGEAREREDRAAQEARALRAENKKLAGPLREAREELSDLRRRMAHYDKDKLALERAIVRAEHSEKETQDLRWEIDIMQMLVDQVREEREQLADRLTEAQTELRLRRAQREVYAERRVHELHQALEQRDAELATRTLGDNTCRRLEAIRPLLEEKNKRIASLTLEVARLQKAHETALEQLAVEMRAHKPDFDDGLRLHPERAATPERQRDRQNNRLQHDRAERR